MHVKSISVSVALVLLQPFCPCSCSIVKVFCWWPDCSISVSVSLGYLSVSQFLFEAASFPTFLPSIPQQCHVSVSWLWNSNSLLCFLYSLFCFLSVQGNLLFPQPTSSFTQYFSFCTLPVPQKPLLPLQFPLSLFPITYLIKMELISHVKCFITLYQVAWIKSQIILLCTSTSMTHIHWECLIHAQSTAVPPPGSALGRVCSVSTRQQITHQAGMGRKNKTWNKRLSLPSAAGLRVHCSFVLKFIPRAVKFPELIWTVLFNAHTAFSLILSLWFTVGVFVPIWAIISNFQKAVINTNIDFSLIHSYLVLPSHILNKLTVDMN